MKDKDSCSNRGPYKTIENAFNLIFRNLTKHDFYTSIMSLNIYLEVCAQEMMSQLLRDKGS